MAANGSIGLPSLTLPDIQMSGMPSARTSSTFHIPVIHINGEEEQWEDDPVFYDPIRRRSFSDSSPQRPDTGAEGPGLLSRRRNSLAESSSLARYQRSKKFGTCPPPKEKCLKELLKTPTLDKSGTNSLTEIPENIIVNQSEDMGTTKKTVSIKIQEPREESGGEQYDTLTSKLPLPLPKRGRQVRSKSVFELPSDAVSRLKEFSNEPDAPLTARPPSGRRGSLIETSTKSPLDIFRQTATSIIISTPSKNNHDKEKPQSPKPPASPLPQAVSRRMSLANVVGLTMFKKMYYSELNAHARKQVEADAQAQSEGLSTGIGSTLESGEVWESSDSEEEEAAARSASPRMRNTSRRKTRSKKTPKKPDLSTEGQIAMVRCYDDKLREGITKQCPQYKRAMYRTRTPPSPEKSAHTSADDSKSPVSGSDTSPERRTEYTLRRAGTLLDALKAEKGETITTTRYRQDNDRVLRPKSKRLVKKYNSWTNSWSQAIK